MLVKLVRRIANKIRHCRYKKIKIKGKNNILQMPEWSTKVFIYGNNNKVVIADTAQFKGEICIGAPDCHTDNCTVTIGENTQSNGTAIRLLEDNSTVDIGSDCLFSTNINIACSHLACRYPSRHQSLRLLVHILSKPYRPPIVLPLG